MAGLGMDIKGKIPASTLPEVLVSLLIIMAVFTIAITISGRLFSSGISITKEQARSGMDSIISGAIRAGDLEEEIIRADSISYYKKVDPYPGYPGLVIIEIEAVQNDVKVGTMRKIARSKL